jgi:hypothetical protein
MMGSPKYPVKSCSRYTGAVRCPVVYAMILPLLRGWGLHAGIVLLPHAVHAEM